MSVISLQLLRLFCRSMSSTTWCPRLACQHPAQVSSSDDCGECPACGFSFCVRCDRAYHGPGDCETRERVKSKAERQADFDREKLELQLRSEEGWGRGREGRLGKDLYEVWRITVKEGPRKAREHVVRVVTEMISGLTREERLQLAKQYLQVTDLCLNLYRSLIKYFLFQRYFHQRLLSSG